MSYFENSFTYKIISGSWFLGWLVSTPEDCPNYYAQSIVYQISNRLIVTITRCLEPLGRFLNDQGKTSLVVNNPFGFIGLLILIYFGFDLGLNDYGVKRTLIEILLAISGLLMLFLKPYGTIWQGSIIYRSFNWWIKTN